MSINLTPFSSDGGFVTAGNITTASSASPAPSISGFQNVNSVNFNASGNISLDGGYINGGEATVVQDGINSIALAPGATMDVFGFPFVAGPTRGQLTISGITSTTQANGTWYYQSFNNNYTYQLYTDSTYTTLVDASGWTAYTGGGIVDITLQSPPTNIVIDSNGFQSIFSNDGRLFLPGSLNSAANLTIMANTQSWTFDNTGVATLPGEGVLQSIGDSVTLRSLNTISGNANSVYLGSSGGLGFNDQEIGGNWLEIFRNGTEPEIRVPVGLGNLNIQTASGNTPYNWTFDDTGNLTLPSNTFAVNYANGTAVSLGGASSYSNSNVATFLAAFGSNTVSTTGNITSGNVTVGTGTITGGNVNGATFNGNVAFGNGTVGGSGNIAGGNISAIGNIVTGGQLQSSAFTGGNIFWAANSRVDFQGAIKVGGTGQILSPGGAASITLNNNGANIPIVGVTNTSNSTSTTTGALIVSGGAGVAGNVYVGGNIVGNTAGFAIGYRDIPQVSFTSNATIATTDAGKHFYSTQSSNFTLTIANNASQGFQVGAAITIVNQGTGTISIAQGSGVTLYLAGNATAGNRSVATFGMATIIKVATDTWFINGTGVS
jgi:hypothetical protein